MRIEKYEIHSEADLLPLKHVWNTLENGDEMTTFQSFSWNRLLVKEWMGWKLHALYSKCMVYIAFEDNQAVMLLPVLVYTVSTKTKWFGNKKGVYLLGHGSYSDYMNAVYTVFSDTAFDAICKEIHSDWRGSQICLNSIREDVATAVYLREKYPDICRSDVSVSVHCQNSAEEYAKSLSKSTRQNLRTALNRMNRDGLTYDMEIVGAIRDQALLEELRAIRIRRMISKNTVKDGILHRLSAQVRIPIRKYRETHNNIVITSMRESPNSCLILIRLNGQIAGYLYGLRDRDSVRIMYNCFDEEYKFYSPLFRGAYDYILSSYKEGIREVDFTRGDEEYKYRLGGEELELYEFSL